MKRRPLSVDKNRMILSLLLMLVIVWSYQANAQLTVSTDRSSALYQQGETAIFSVQSTNSGPVQYKIYYDRFTSIIDSGTINPVAGQEAEIRHQQAIPASLICEVSQNGQIQKSFAAFSPYETSYQEEAPADFDQFWKQQRDASDAVPLNPEIFFLRKNDYSTTYSLRLDHIDGRKIYGLVVVPDSPPPYTGFVSFPSFGDIPNIVEADIGLAERANAVSVSISIHNAPIDQVDPLAYQPDQVDDRLLYYQRYAIIAGIRSIDYLISRGDVAADQIGTFGVSQGGGLALSVAGVDDRVKLLAFSNPSSCNHPGLNYDLPSGFPYYLLRSIQTNGAASHFEATLEASKYYDGVYFAQRYKGPVLGLTSLRDETTVPMTQMAAYNQIEHEKFHLFSRDLVHDQNPVQYWVGRLAFIRRHFPLAASAPWPWLSESTGYELKLNYATEAVVNEAFSFSGAALHDDQKIAARNPQWKLIEGPGAVNFSSKDDFGTTAEFTAPGDYTISFEVDLDTLSEQGQYFHLTNYAKVTVLQSVATNDFTSEKSLELFPNPVNDQLYLDTKGQTLVRFQLFDSTGQGFRSGQFQPGENIHTIDVSTLSNGVYLMVAEDQDQQLYRTHFVVTHR